jgi:DNA-binding transcriptional ArsR family regulator
MQDQSLSRAARVRDRKTAAALADPLKRRIVLSCVARERAIAELAGAMGMDLRQLHYHIGVLVRRGLLVVSHTRPRAGRPIKFYRASACAYFVPSEIAVEMPSAALARQMEAALLAARRRDDEGILYEVTATGEPRMRIVAGSSQPASTPAELWRVLALSAQDAQRLSGEIRAVLAKYADRSGGAWLVHFALCPTKLPRLKRG